jgi:Toprim domain
LIGVLMSLETEDLLRELAQNAESVCRHYLPAGRREGSYWMVGDLQNNAGRSLFVRLVGPASGPGAAGKYTDAATGDHGDLLDIIRERTGITRFPDLLAEARAQLGRPAPVIPDGQSPKKPKSPGGGTPEAAARLFAASVPVAGSLAETYLFSRGITLPVASSALRFHPKCWHRDEGQTRSIPRPALIAAVTDGAGVCQGAHRTWLAPDGQDKAAVDTPRRAMGHILGNAVRIVPADQTLVLGEGIETMLSVRVAVPSLPVWSALSSSHLGAVLLPAGLQRLYIAIDRDPAGQGAAERLTARATEAGIAVQVLEPRLGDFNDDLRAHGAEALRQHLAQQIDPKDQHRLTI